MTTSDTTKPTRPEHPHSGLVDDEALQTLFNVCNTMELMQRFYDEDAEITGTELAALRLMNMECMKAIAFEQTRIIENEEHQKSSEKINDYKTTPEQVMTSLLSTESVLKVKGALPT